MTPIQTSKSPSEVLDYTLNLEGPGFVGDTIASATINSSGGVVAIQSAIGSRSYSYTLSGGAPNRVSVVRILLTTARGAVHEVEHTVRVVA